MTAPGEPLELLDADPDPEPDDENDDEPLDLLPGDDPLDELPEPLPDPDPLPEPDPLPDPPELFDSPGVPPGPLSPVSLWTQTPSARNVLVPGMWMATVRAGASTRSTVSTISLLRSASMRQSRRQFGRGEAPLRWVAAAD